MSRAQGCSAAPGLFFAFLRKRGGSMSESDQIDLIAELNEHVSDVHRVLSHRLREPTDISDVLQELWLKILTLPSTESIRHPRAFLLRVATNLAIDWLRRRSGDLQRRVELDDVAEQLSLLPNQETMVQARQELRLLDAAIDELPPKCRRAFLLHKLQHWSHKEIADHMGISQNMVEKHVMKALSHCRKRLAFATS